MIGRVLIALPGLAALGWGAYLFVQFALTSADQTLSALLFLAGGPVLHDAVLAPVAALAGLVLTRVLPGPWRTPVRIGAAFSLLLALLAVPALWRAHAALPNPGLVDRDYGTGLLVALGAVWLVVLSWGVIAAWRGRGRGTPAPPGSPAPPPARPGPDSPAAADR
ncbi:hypothetical protein GCM10027445_34660 [Amycolatopsis endophytica]|uniref:Uncharacterized protein n=1 Tax=Amycolatopsis endophytica TaxID=860233 RepID=A0A853BB69_9PSEU|nr:hypothetical protein [Amycolatopsis endophytica]NYI92025.1 hypothetical protein [Amycolatopsis endophytica]